jgi:hypothetical protein
MPLKLSTTIRKIQNIPNLKNIEVINEFLGYMESNGSSEHHQNNNLKVVIAYGNFIGKDNSFYDINKKDQVLEFLNTKVISYEEDPEKDLLINNILYPNENPQSGFFIISYEEKIARIADTLYNIALENNTNNILNS